MTLAAMDGQTQIEFTFSCSGNSIPSNAAIDDSGQPTSDAYAFAKHLQSLRTDPAAGLQGAQLPMAGHKVLSASCTFFSQGTSLSLMVELLAASFTGRFYIHFWC